MESFAQWQMQKLPSNVLPLDEQQQQGFLWGSRWWVLPQEVGVGMEVRSEAVSTQPQLKSSGEE